MVRPTLMLLLVPSLLVAQSGGAAPIDMAALTRRVVDSVAAIADARYVFPDTGRMVADHLRRRLRDGAFADITEPAQLADRITREMQAVNGDRHLYVNYGAPARDAGPRMVMRRPGAGSAGGGGGAGAGGPAAGDPTLAAARRANFDLNRVERLAGNVGYLSIGMFSTRGSDEAFDVIDAAMAFLGRVDALIIDLRRTPGGEPRMVDYIASYFFEREGMPTLNSYMRAMDRTLERTTVRVNGRPRPALPLYLLVGTGTASGAEDFSFIMKQTGRATLVGGTTAGAGRLTGLFPAGDGFAVSVSGGRTWDPRTGREWERTGIQPDVAAGDHDALTVAHVAALERLASTAAEPARAALDWVRRGVLARAAPYRVSDAALATFAGEYDVRLVRLENGRLWYQRDATRPREELVPVSADTFIMGEAIRVDFLRDGNRVTAMRLSQSGAPASTFPRTR